MPRNEQQGGRGGKHEEGHRRALNAAFPFNLQALERKVKEGQGAVCAGGDEFVAQTHLRGVSDAM